MSIVKNDKYDIGFVVLHYMNKKMTMLCINALVKNFENDRVFIVVVDNNSPNITGKLRNNDFMDLPNVHVIINETNMGFANGNNVGYQWIKQNIYCDYIGVINNDIIISQKNIVQLLNKELKETSFAVLGPDIISKRTGKHQNPVSDNGMSLEELEEYCSRIRKANRCFACFYYKRLVVRLINIFIHREKNEETKCIEQKINPVLHGSCYFFSREYINKREYAFNPGTFMFFEEDILHYECIKSGLKMLFYPNIQVYHYEDVSTKTYIRSKYSREKWIYNEGLKSGEYFINLIKRDMK